MAKKSSNSGFERQEAVMSQFRRDARSKDTGNSAVAQALRAGKKNAEYRAKRQAEEAAKPRVSFKFLSTGK
jgi:hypothetical protein